MTRTILTAAFIFAGFSASADIHVNLHDLDGDGRVTLQEVMDSHPQSVERDQAFADRYTNMFAAADANGDGFIDLSESQGNGISRGRRKKTN